MIYPRLHMRIDVQSLPASCELDLQFGVQIFRQKDIASVPFRTSPNNYSSGIPSFLFRFRFRLWVLQWRCLCARFGSQSARKVQGHRSGMWCQAAPWFLGDTESQGAELEWLAVGLCWFGYIRYLLVATH